MLSFTIITLLTVWIISCKKSSSTPGSTITATINGVNKNFNLMAKALKGTSGGVTEIVISGNNSNSSTSSQTLQFTLDNSFSGDSITTGTYTDTSSTINLTGLFAINAPGNDSIYEGGSTVYENALYDSVTIIKHLTVTIISFSETAITGTFSGDLFPFGNDAATPISLTNGTFNVRFE
jgi:hypothetical protein